MSYLSQLSRSVFPHIDAEYVDDPNLLSLHTTQSPYPPSPKAIEAARGFAFEQLNLYPDPQCSQLSEAIAAFHGLRADQVFVANGEEEIISLTIPTFFDAGDEVASADMTNRLYRTALRMYGVKHRGIEVPEDFRLSAEHFRDLPEHGLLITNPDIPTGTTIGRNDMLQIVRENADKIVIVDERYAEFSNCSIAAFVSDYPNLVVVRTFAKAFGLAGLRCGYAVADAELISGLRTIKQSLGHYPMDTFTQTIATAAIGDKDYLAQTVHRIVRTRENVAERLRAMQCQVLPSGANFLMVKPPNVPASEVAYQLREQGIIVRHYKYPPVDEYFCVTIVRDEDMQFFLDTMARLRI